MFSAGAVVVNCQPGGTWPLSTVPAPTTRYPTSGPTSAPPTALAPTRPPTSGPTTAPPTVPTAPAPTSPPIDDLHASCGSNFSCFTDLNTPTGLGVFARHPCETEPKQNEPHISFGAPSTRQGITALVRGHGGVAGALRGGNATAGDDVMHIWILDQDGDTLCHQEYPSNCNSRDPVLACSIARTGEVVAVQAHVFCRRSGLYSGPVRNVAYEVYARSKEHSTSPSCVGPGHYHQASLGAAADPEHRERAHVRHHGRHRGGPESLCDRASALADLVQPAGLRKHTTRHLVGGCPPFDQHAGKQRCCLHPPPSLAQRMHLQRQPDRHSNEPFGR